MTIGKRIQEIRLQKGLTQKELAEASGLATGTIQQYELGKRTPKPNTIKTIATILGATPFDLMGAEWFDIQLGTEKLSKLSGQVATLINVEEAYGKVVADLLGTISILNEVGQAKAQAYVFDLAEQPKYLKEPEK